MNQRKKYLRFTRSGFVNILLLFFFLGVALSPFAGTCAGDRSAGVFAENENPLGKSKAIEGAMVLQQALREIYREVNPAVVRIETEQIVQMPLHPFFNDPVFRRFFGIPEGGAKQKRTGLGSGFVISKDGYIVTNHHVVGGVDKITVKFVNGREATARLVGSDKASDIALLKVDKYKDLKTVYFGDSDKIEVGDIAIAIGNPFGLSSTFTMGVISSKGQDVNSADGIPRIQTDAPINPGNSGGPLLNLRGEVIGINQMIYSQTGGSIGIGFAIPINHALQVIEKLKTGKQVKPGYVGISILPEPSEEILQALGIPANRKGLLVREVIVPSPAYKAGIRANDYIVEIDGKQADSFSVLKSTVMAKGPGKEVKIKVFREGEYKTFTVIIGEAPEE
ncbi:MAG: trypsin-like peptidase domain-containing protein [Leptospiraceae bacterium]|nr:trypsin-like peptidase domain-containing protein [Leptospiraceae bacterium]MDW8305668.1 trypsin-like peptidase domain-containing protein [Leptospiraceae bacterium]